MKVIYLEKERRYLIKAIGLLKKKAFSKDIISEWKLEEKIYRYKTS